MESSEPITSTIRVRGGVRPVRGNHVKRGEYLKELEQYWEYQIREWESEQRREELEQYLSDIRRTENVSSFMCLLDKLDKDEGKVF